MKIMRLTAKKDMPRNLVDLTLNQIFNDDIKLNISATVTTKELDMIVSLFEKLINKNKINKIKKDENKRRKNQQHTPIMHTDKPVNTRPNDKACRRDTYDV